MHFTKISYFYKIIAVFLIGFIGIVFGCNSLFMHSHKVNDVIIWHSHPFPNAQHTTQTSYITIAQLNNAVAILSDSYTFVSYNNLHIGDVESPGIAQNFQQTSFVAVQRGPPTV